jgi:hypothetical protein
MEKKILKKLIWIHFLRIFLIKQKLKYQLIKRNLFKYRNKKYKKINKLVFKLTIKIILIIYYMIVLNVVNQPR